MFNFLYFLKDFLAYSTIYLLATDQI